MNMFKFNDYVKASDIWETAKDFVDSGEKSGLVRGYNIEVKTSDGSLHWLSCEYFFGTPEDEFNNEFHTWMYAEHGWTPTGRICFRGYGLEDYDYRDHETYIIPCDKDGRRI